MQRLAGKCRRLLVNLLQVGAGPDHDRGHIQAIRGQRARFVEHDRIDPGACFQGLQPPHQHTAARQCSRSSEGGSGRRQRQGARTGHDQNRDGHTDRVGRTGRPPPGGCAGTRQQHQQQKRTGDAVRKLRQARLVQRCLLHQGDDPRVTGLAPSARHPHFQRTTEVVAARDHGESPAAQERLRLAGQQGFVDAAFPGLDRSVGRDHFTRKHPDQVAGPNAAHRNPLEHSCGIFFIHALRQPAHQGF